MTKSETVRVEIDAERALIDWKWTFSDAVCEHAARLASQSDQPNLITLAHYREAAQLALQSLSQAIQARDPRDANPRAA